MDGGDVSTQVPVTIVAEAAQGFEGDPFVARLLVRAAAAGRADLVKFQLVYADELATREYPYHGLFTGLEMPPEAWAGVAAEAKRRGIGLVFDVYGPRALDLALRLGAAAVKVHATDFFNDPLVDAAVARAPAVHFSAGGIEADEIEAWLKRLGPGALGKLTLLYGFQAEPTAPADNHLRRLAALRERFAGLRLGFMDHAAGDSDEAGWLGLLALPFGISVIEKHVTLDRALGLEDYVSAATAAELATYVRRVRLAEAALGRGDLALSPTERTYRHKALKAVVAVRALKAGERIEAADLTLLRAPLPEAGAVLRRPADAAGRRLARALAAGQAICAEDLA
jgi:sialic acid synthase SpsE